MITETAVWILAAVNMVGVGFALADWKTRVISQNRHAALLEEYKELLKKVNELHNDAVKQNVSTMDRLAAIEFHIALKGQNAPTRKP